LSMPVLGRSQNVLVTPQLECPVMAGCFSEDVPTHRGWLRAMIRYPLVMLVEQGNLLARGKRQSQQGTTTLLCSCVDENRCHRTLLKGLLERG
jgi:hypothetical protein